ncbi:MAG: Asp-tRNA(Asn)/Glu-tRNA(Gln) amidotransferase subunit GatB [Gammaproteobacteria bacterium]|nr:Asp-tRNA(Asn)/Glu-tRNA(Gln) amidotransferase subunit GatB [Gammaproteobacteria bacterium]
MSANWESVIGLEVHVQLATESKIFSDAPVAAGGEPNSRASCVDLGLPGVLPVLNESTLGMAVTFGLAVEGEIARECRFDRKNYFYPDLPKGYQISQLADPVVSGGHLDIDLGEGQRRRIRLTRAHLEEDAGKSIHDAYAGLSGIDLNRAGTPLLEVVSEPELRSPEEAAQYFRALHSLVRALGICDGNLSEGSMRCDANISIRPVGQATFGERTEIKNINSFRFVERALAFEIERQIGVVEAGGEVVRETRLYDAERDETRPMRGKETSEDYRYFPDPDLLPVVVTDAMLEEARARLPELPAAKRERYSRDFALDAYACSRLTDEPDLARYFEAVTATGVEPRQAANWVLGEVSAALNRDERDAHDIPVPAEALGTLIARIDEGVVSGAAARTVLATLWQEGGDVDTHIARSGLAQLNDDDELRRLAREAVERHPDQAVQYRAGKTKLLGFFVGQVMKASQGKANPRQVNDLLRELLADP